MRLVLLALVALAAPLLAAEPVPAPSSPSSLVGTWNVTSTVAVGGTCPGVTVGEVTAAIWLVSTTPAGGVSVAVQGETQFPSLTGKAEKGRVYLTGYSTPTSAPGGYRSRVASLNLEAKGGEIIGLRRFLAFAELEAPDKTKVLIPCFTDMEVSGKR